MNSLSTGIRESLEVALSTIERRRLESLSEAGNPFR